MSNLPIFETFYSVQGEGKNVGMAAYFIRLAGCNVGCSFCDEKRAWQNTPSQLLSIETIVNEVKRNHATNVIVTGGEPTIYDLNELTEALHESGIKTYLETSGVNVITGQWDWITLSPKQIHEPLLESLQRANELKVVIERKEDFKFACAMKEKCPAGTVCYLQPEYSQYKTIIPMIIEYIKTDTIWRLSIQTHKMINVK